MSKPRLSSTVLLLRDGPGLQVLMVKRHYEIDFAAGALVFPGGKAVEDDHDERWSDHCDGDHIGAERAARISAVREAFEETGVVMARAKRNRGAGAPLVGSDVVDALAPHRSAVDRGEESFLALVEAHGLVLALDALVHFGHWITPDIMPKRFDTHFYIAIAPDEQTARHDGRETTDAVWLGPQEALDMEAAGDATIIFPTRMNLGKLAQAKTAKTAIDTFSAQPVVTVLPSVEKTEQGEPCLRIPKEAGYIQTIELLERVKV